MSPNQKLRPRRMDVFEGIAGQRIGHIEPNLDRIVEKRLSNGNKGRAQSNGSAPEKGQSMGLQ